MGSFNFLFITDQSPLFTVLAMDVKFKFFFIKIKRVGDFKSIVFHEQTTLQLTPSSPATKVPQAIRFVFFVCHAEVFQTSLQGMNVSVYIQS